MAAGYGDGTATLAFTRLLRRPALSRRRYSFHDRLEWRAWSAPVRRTDDDLDHSDPQVAYNTQPAASGLAGRTGIAPMESHNRLHVRLTSPDEIGGR